MEKREGKEKRAGKPQKKETTKETTTKPEQKLREQS
jgi:hypothetical protein